MRQLMRIVVFGDSTFVLETMSRLNQNQFHVIYADNDASRLKQAQTMGMATQSADYRLDEDLVALGIGSTIDMLFCFFKEDYDNVFLTISARALDTSLKIVALIDNPQSANKLIAAGADKIIDPYQICARRMHELVKKPHLTEMLDHTVFGRQDLKLEEVIIPEHSTLNQTWLSELKSHNTHNLIIIGVIDLEQSREMNFVLGDKDHRLDSGDSLLVLGPERAIKLFIEDIQ